MKKKQKKVLSFKQVRQNRTLIILAVFTLILIRILYKLFYLQIVDASEQYKTQIQQSIDEVAVSASRGNIYDRNGNVLAQDSSAKAVHVIPLDVEEGKEKELAKVLSEKLAMDYNKVYGIVTQLENDKVEMRNGVSKDNANKVIKAVPKGIEYENETLYCVPIEIEDAKKAATSIAEILEMDESDVYDYLVKRENSAVKVKGKVDNALAQEILDSQSTKNEAGTIKSTNGVELIEDSRRYYTNGNFASYVLGFTNENYDGVTGIEATCNGILSGEDGVAYFQKDATGKTIPSQTKTIKQPTPGKDVTLSLDSNAQNIAEKAITSAITEWEAKSGTAIVMETKTGKILAMATKPDYDLNDPYTLSTAFKDKNSEELATMDESNQLSEMWKNPAVAFNYEPGSTFKAITSSAALEEGVVTPNTTVVCSGSINIDGVTVNCTGNHGTQTVTQAIANSCNPGLVQIIQKLNPLKFYQYAYNFGYGETTGIELTGEESGVFSRRFDDDGTINTLDYSTMSFGQGLSTTPIQNLSALNCVVNNGYYMEPSVLMDDNDDSLSINGKLGSDKQIISSETSKEMRDIMVNVVSENATLKNMSEGYSIGGKTGTAEKFIDGAYSKTAYVTSFFGYAPVEDPQYSVLVVLDEPKEGASGGGSAAPAAINIIKQLMGSSEADATGEDANGSITIPDMAGQNIDTAKKMLEEKGIAYTVEQQDNGTTILSQSIAPHTVYEKDDSVELVVGTAETTTGKVKVPDLTGQSVQACNELLSGVGLKLKVEGSGFAKSQNPTTGTEVEQGATITVKFAE